MKLLTLAALMWMILPLQAQKEPYSCRWHDASIRKLAMSDYRQEGAIHYLLSNDGDYLYVNLMVPDEYDQRKILLFGNTIWLDLEGKTRKKQGVRFPSRDKREQASGQQPQGQRPSQGDQSGMRRSAMRDFDAVKEEMAGRSQTLALLHLCDTAEEVVIPAHHPMELHGWLAYEDDLLRYTLVIPFIKVPLDRVEGKKGFSIGLETGYLDMEQMGGRPGGGQGGGQGGMGGPPPGGRQSMDPSQREQMMKMRDELSLATRFWIRNIRLAEGPPD